MGSSLRSFPDRVFRVFGWLYRRFTGVRNYLPYSRGDVVLEKALEVMEKHPDNLFLCVHLMDVHHPFYAKIVKRSHDELVSLNDKYVDAMDGLSRPTALELDALKGLYRQEVVELDSYIGDYYEKASYADMLGIVTSPHGEEFGEHGEYGHRVDRFIPELRHVPLIMVGSKENSTISEPISHFELSMRLLNGMEAPQ